MLDRQPFFVYRDQIGVPSEISFLRRQYIGFSHLQPIWIGRTLLPAASAVGDRTVRLGGDGPLGGLRRLMFRYFDRIALEARSSELGFAPLLHAQFARGGVLALPLARSLGARLVVTLHGGDVSKQKNWRRGVLTQRWPALMREVSRFICVSAAVAEIAVARGVPTGKLIVLPIGVEIPPQPPAACHPTSHLFVGRFVEKKGIAVLADAVRRLRAGGDSTPLVCIGDGPLRPVLEALARDVSDVTLTGWLNPAAVRTHMAAAVCLIAPSIVAQGGDAEGLPSVIPEAMAQACPVIGSEQGGIAEAVRHGQTGLLVPPGDAASLATAMHTIAYDPGLRATLGLAGYAVATTALNACIQSASLERLLLSVIAEQHRPNATLARRL